MQEDEKETPPVWSSHRTPHHPSPSPEARLREEYSATKAPPLEKDGQHAPDPGFEKVRAKVDLRAPVQLHGETEAQGRAEASSSLQMRLTQLGTLLPHLRKGVLSLSKNPKSSRAYELWGGSAQATPSPGVC